MSITGKKLAVSVACLVIGALALAAQGQTIHLEARAWASNVVVPQSRTFSLDHSRQVQLTGVTVEVSITDQTATTVMDINLRNPTGTRLEAELLVPVPDGAVVKGFSFAGSSKEPTAELLPKDSATATYKSIVAKMKDPAMLEFAGSNVIRSSVFPVEARGTQKVRLTYENLLPADGNRVDYVLPRTESIDYNIPWDIAVKIQSKRPISTVYSSSHKIDTVRVRDNSVLAKVAKDATTQPGAFTLSYLQEDSQGVTASLMAYPDAKIDGGYFLLLAGLPAKPAGAQAAKRELTIVIDRSGSMSGPKIDQARKAALQVIEGLADGETFNIIDFSDSISSFAATPVSRTSGHIREARAYIEKLSAAGGTNIHDALTEALRPQPAKGLLPMVLFITDGLPTVGVQQEVAIRDAAIAANKHEHRIFTFGVGFDVNAPLLTHLAEKSRGTSTFVLPEEDIEVKVSQISRRISGPVLAAPTLTVVDEHGQPLTRRTRDLLPAALPDMFEGGQLVILGKYVGDQPIRFRLAGNFQGQPRTFEFQFNLDKATTKNNFVPRLWASRKIARLIEDIRQGGAAATGTYAANTLPPASDPRTKELVDEIVHLSMEFGILTEYTAFLAKEGTDLTHRDQLLSDTNSNLMNRAVASRSGMGGVNQAVNNSMQISQYNLNRTNGYVDQNMNRVQITTVQQVNDRAFFHQNGRWTDSSVYGPGNDDKPDQTVTVGSPEFDKLLDQLLKENRQGALSMKGDVLLNVGGKKVLVKGQ